LQPINVAVQSVRSDNRAPKCFMRIKPPPKKMLSGSMVRDAR
jgi:hypothetical protein